MYLYMLYYSIWMIYSDYGLVLIYSDINVVVGMYKKAISFKYLTMYLRYGT